MKWLDYGAVKIYWDNHFKFFAVYPLEQDKLNTNAMESIHEIDGVWKSQLGLFSQEPPEWIWKEIEMRLDGKKPLFGGLRHCNDDKVQSLKNLED